MYSFNINAHALHIISPRSAKHHGFLAATLLLSAWVPGTARAQNTPAASQPVLAAAPIGALGMVPLREVPAAATGPMHPAPSEMNSVSAMTKLVADLEAKQKALKAQRAKRLAAALKAGLLPPGMDVEEEGHGDGDDDDDDATEFLGPYLQEYAMRAFPKDKVDSTAYARAYAHRKTMAHATSIPAMRAIAKARAKSGAPASVAAPAAAAATTPATSSAAVALPASSNWFYIGPNNLPPPYVTYYGPLQSILTGRVNGIAYDPTASGTVYLVAPGGGVWKSIDNGVVWSVLSDNAYFAHLQASSVAVSPADGSVLVGMGDYDGYDYSGYSVGIMRSTDGGNTWANVGMALAGLGVSAIKFDPDYPKIVVATAGRGAAPGQIFRSIDGGVTWAATTAPTGNWSTVTIGTEDATGNRAFYASLEANGIYKSTDKGVTWTKVPLYLPYNNGVGGLVGLKVAASVTDPNTVYVADGTVDVDDGDIFKSTNGGTSWVDITGNYNDNGVAYNEIQQIEATPGYNWAQCEYDLQLTPGSLSVNGTKTDALYLGGLTLSGTPTGNGAWTDIGQALTLSNDITHSDQHAMAINPLNSNLALFGDDGGLYGLTYNTNTHSWSTAANGGLMLNKTLGLTQIYHADFSQNNTNVLITGTQDNASPVSTGDPNNWVNRAGGDGGGCAINTSTDQIQYATVYNAEIYHTNNLWASEDIISYVDANGNVFDGDNLAFISVLTVNPTYPNYMFLGTNYLWLWNENLYNPDDTNAGWTQHVGNTALTSGLVTAIACGYENGSSGNPNLGTPTPGGVVYAGTSDGRLWMTLNATGGNSCKWVEINSPSGGQGLPAAAISSISVNPNNPFDILVGLSGTGAGHLYRCTNTFGAPSVTFINVSGNTGFNSLPQIPLNDVTRDPDDPTETFYAATDIGVFMTTDSGANWVDATVPLGLPNVQCSTIKAAGGYLNVATYGRGVWRLSLGETSANLTVKSGLTRSGSSVVLTLIITNSGGTNAMNVAVSSASLLVGNTSIGGLNLPQTVGNLAAGSSATVTVTFPAGAISSGVLGTLSGTLTYMGGTAAIAQSRTRMP